MILAALISAGAPLEEIFESLRGLHVPFDIETEVVEVSGIRALRVVVSHPEEHAHRTFRDIQNLIENAGLPERAGQRSVEAFRRLAVAEGEIHGRDPEEVTFHEVGAVDSIVDLVGSCVALELLSADSVSCGLLPVGSGVTRSAHGPLPAPGPATLEILKSSRIHWVDEPHEMTTPTGAALMSALTGGEFTDAAPPMTLDTVGYGAGAASFERVPNLLRAVVGTLEGSAGDVELIEANVDDASGEILGSAIERLLEAGALDAWLEPIVMKKGRGAYKVCALVFCKDLGYFAQLLMREAGTLGVRHHAVGRTVAERRLVEVELPYGRCRVKVGSLDGEDFIASPEHEDAVRLAGKTGLALPQIYAEIREVLGHQLLGKT